MKLRYHLTPAVQAQIVAYIRAGAYDWLAAEAAGIPRTVFQDWLDRGARRRRQPYRRFHEQIQQAKAQARLAAEIAALKKNPQFWLRHGPGREAHQAPGWTAPVKALAPAEHQTSVFMSSDWIKLYATIRHILSAYPEARAALVQALDELG